MGSDTLTTTDVQMAFNEPNAAKVFHVAKAFDTIEDFWRALDSDTEISEYEHIGPRTAKKIESWAETRYDDDVPNAPFVRTKAEMDRMNKDELAAIVSREEEDVTEVAAQYAFDLLVEKFDGDEDAAFVYQQFGTVDAAI